MHLNTEKKKRAIALKDDRDIETEGEFDDESIPPLEDASDVEYPIDRDLLVVKRALGVQINEDEKVQTIQVNKLMYQNNYKIRFHCMPNLEI